MKTLLDKNSLAGTIDNVSEAMLFGKAIGKKDKTAIAEFIADQHGKPYSYANMFSPTEEDMKRDLVLFTGEKIKSGAGKCHVIGEEASRIIRKLNIHSEKINKAVSEADEGLISRIDANRDHPRFIYGAYCCKSCSCAMWLNLSAGGLKNDTKMLKAGLKWLKLHRDGKGRWKGFPYYYTLYVLNEIDPEIAGDEIRYAVKSLEKRLKTAKNNNDKYEIRRNYICTSLIKKAVK